MLTWLTGARLNRDNAEIYYRKSPPKVSIGPSPGHPAFHENAALPDAGRHSGAISASTDAAGAA